MKLQDYLDPLAYDIAFWLAAYQDAGYDLDQLGDVTVDVTLKLRAAAIIGLLTKGEPDLYFHNLIRSARCRIAYLQRLRQHGVNAAHHQSSARVGPLLDAIAAADFDSARQIVALSLTEWNRGHEYEDDYYYAQIVQELITVPRNDERLGRLFEGFERVLDGQSDARLDVTRALARGDPDEFEPAFEALLAQRRLQIEAEKARSRIEEPATLAERHVYVEGLAMLQIASRLKFAAQSEYEYCPSLALVPMQQPFPGE